MASKKVSAMTELAAFADGDLVYLVDISESNDVDKGKKAKFISLKRKIEREKALRTETSDYSIVQDDFYILADASAGAVTITLPDATTLTGYEYHITKIDATNNVTIDTTGSQTIGGSASVTLTNQYEFIKVVSDGSNWHIVASS